MLNSRTMDTISDDFNQRTDLHSQDRERFRIFKIQLQVAKDLKVYD